MSQHIRRAVGPGTAHHPAAQPLMRSTKSSAEFPVPPKCPLDEPGLSPARMSKDALLLGATRPRLASRPEVPAGVVGAGVPSSAIGLSRVTIKIRNQG